MARKVICRHCNQKDDQTTMTKIDKVYVHHSCIDDYEKELEIKQNEIKQFNDLYDYLKDLHNVISIPPRNIKRLRSELHDKHGYGFDLILDAYKLSEDKIKWFIHHVLKGNCDADGINKAMTLMLNTGINAAYRKRKERERQQIYAEHVKQQTYSQDMSNAHNYAQTRKDEKDISSLLE